MAMPSILEITLSAAVPLRIAELAGTSPDRRLALATGAADTLAAHGDDLLYGGEHCRAAFGAVVRALAIGAYQPGGIHFAGTLWCAVHHPHGGREEWPCPPCVEAGMPAPGPQPQQRPVDTIPVAGGRL
jgi:hypothetical protein